MDKSENLIVYSTPTCPMLPPVLAMLKQSNVPYDYVDISKDAQAHETVVTINNGNASVPTLLFPDGTTLTEPSGNELRTKLQAIGYKVPLHALIAGSFWQIMLFLGILLAILRGIGLF